MVDGGARNMACQNPNARNAIPHWLPVSRRKAIGAMSTIAPSRNVSFAVPNGQKDLQSGMKQSLGNSRRHVPSEFN